MSGIEEILSGYQDLQADQEAFYRDLHRHPELSHAEHRTAGRVAEETGDGAQGMVDGGLLQRIPAPAVALSQHVLPGVSGTVATRPGLVMSAADSLRVTVHGRGGHGSMPQNAVDRWCSRP